MELQDVLVYHGGRYVPYGDAKVGLLTHGLNYGTGCFEGIRGYWDERREQVNLFRLRDHFERMRQSCGLLLIDLPYSDDELCMHATELIRINGYRQDVYIRPLAFKASEEVGVRLHNVRDDFAIVAVAHRNYFEGSQGLRACVSSWRRMDDNTAPARAKLTGIYVSSALAKTEAHNNGFDEAILLMHDGHVAEGSAENIFIVRNGAVITPPVCDNILEGITRSSLIELCSAELGLEVAERSIDRSELYVADEIFFSGTAVGVSPVIEVDHRPVGHRTVGRVAQALSELYHEITLGRHERYLRWLTPCYPKDALRPQPALRIGSDVVASSG